MKYCKNLKRLFLDGCGINDQLLQLLAAAITEGCKIQALDIDWNQYTSDGLTQFLHTLVSRVQHTRLVALSTNELTNEHHSLGFNAKRKQLLMWPFFPKTLTIACKNKLWDKEGKAMLNVYTYNNIIINPKSVLILCKNSFMTLIIIELIPSKLH